MRRLKSLSGVPWCGRTECDRAAFKVKVNRDKQCNARTDSNSV
uniref:Uncharacterized protein n=1 Tax=Anguilla anguilla TaxID=7936 RepID=A0A0E9SFS6_ANGAN